MWFWLAACSDYEIVQRPPAPEPVVCELAEPPAPPVAVDSTCEWTTTTSVSGTGDPLTPDWDLALEWELTLTTGAAPVVGQLDDDDGDGAVTEADEPEIVLVDWATLPSTLRVLTAGGVEVLTVPGMAPFGSPVIADVDRDGTPEIITIGYDRRLRALHKDGSVLWTSAPSCNFIEIPEIAVGDLEGDGTVEVVCHGHVYAGATGHVLFEIPLATDGGFSFPILADLDLDGVQEILQEGTVFSAAGVELWSDPVDAPWNHLGAVGNLDDDDEAEVVWTVSAPNGRIGVFDHTGVLLHETPSPSPLYLGPIAIADTDGDGEAEIAVASPPWLVLYDRTLEERWRAPISDWIGAPSAFDFDADGAYEILFSDGRSLRIFDGATGAVLARVAPIAGAGGYPQFQSPWNGLPMVVDLDRDGAAEIVFAVTGYPGGLFVYGPAGAPWAGAGSSWSISDFQATNIGDDGQVPIATPHPWLVDGLFRGRPPSPVRIQEHVAPDPHLEVLESCGDGCDGGAVQVAWRVSNEGAGRLAAGELKFGVVRSGVRIALVATGVPELAPGEATSGVLEIADGVLVRNAAAVAVWLEAGDTTRCHETSLVWEQALETCSGSVPEAR